MFGVHQFFIGDSGRGQEYLDSFGVCLISMLIAAACGLPFLLAGNPDASSVVYGIIMILFLPFTFNSFMSFTLMFFVDLFSLAFQVIASEY